MIFSTASALTDTGPLISSVAPRKTSTTPLFKISNDGKVELVDKIRGKKQGIRKLKSLISENITNLDNLFICHCDAFEIAEEISNSLRELNLNSEIIINDLGPILGNNTGPGTLAVFFYGSGR